MHVVEKINKKSPSQESSVDKAVKLSRYTMQAPRRRGNI
jgi:hypothetical protein